MKKESKQNKLFSDKDFDERPIRKRDCSELDTFVVPTYKIKKGKSK